MSHKNDEIDEKYYSLKARQLKVVIRFHYLSLCLTLCSTSTLLAFPNLSSVPTRYPVIRLILMLLLLSLVNTVVNN